MSGISLAGLAKQSCSRVVLLSVNSFSVHFLFTRKEIKAHCSCLASQFIDPQSLQPSSGVFQTVCFFWWDFLFKTEVTQSLSYMTAHLTILDVGASKMVICANISFVLQLIMYNSFYANDKYQCRIMTF